MSSFTDPLVITPGEKGRYRLERPFSFDIGLKGSGLLVTVPAGYVTDLASVPRWLWWFLPPFEPQYAAAAVLHDYLLTWSGFDRLTAHTTFLDALKILCVERWKATAMFLAVVIYDSARR
ncbi:MAG: DUF1353 domain-containing protein [Candidatus Devosia phytovorans]|uniref:DUF1353 domain-containing protein n=1 Tax=Candidatus Devosia phytovorans TaxID=3121372 RepID=A0AAJ5VUU3_9HYPH|nr:DUF1353 domain-containing protein [Devosia sp.]WEK04570.1 MAG: DUF1353 domain-containing protein [Devosia sp.]